MGLLAAAAGLWLRRRDRTTWLLLGMMLVFPAGYFFFWGSRLASGFAYLSGPVYFIPLFVPLCLFIATALIALWRHRRGLLIGLVCVMAVATVPFLYDKSAMNHRLSEAQVPWQRATESLPGKSLVIVRDSGPYLLHLNPFSQNATRSRRPGAVRGRQGGGVVPAHRPLPRPHPLHRTHQQPALDDAIHHPDASPPTVTMLPVKIVSGPAVTLTVRVRSPQRRARRRRRAHHREPGRAAFVATVGGG